MKRNLLTVVLITGISFGASMSGAWFYQQVQIEPAVKQTNIEAAPAPVRRMAEWQESVASDFRQASEQSRPAVVYIKVVSEGQRQPHDFFFDFFGNIGPVSSSGSGVIVSPDGYIVTNQHVVKGARKITVVLNNNKREYAASVVGEDPSTDLALLKIEATGLPSIRFSNSDGLMIGDWVLAVGNPFNLTSSVTAGIVSAKGRNINIVRNQFPIESFIQTDAAINPGNSGGALVNTAGELVGVNTAIMSRTGAFNGYGFAIPSNIVAKVIADLKEFGFVQRAFIEASFTEMNEALAKKSGEQDALGVYVDDVYEEGNAAKGGLKKGDVVVKIGNRMIESRSDFEEELAYRRPGDKAELTVKRNNDLKKLAVTLHNNNGTTGREKAEVFRSEALAADFSKLSWLERKSLNIENGFRLTNVSPHSRLRRMGLDEGFVITRFNNVAYDKPQELAKAIESARGQILVEGVGNDGQRVRYSFFGY